MPALSLLPGEDESLLGLCLRRLPFPGGLHLIRRELGISGARLPKLEDMDRLASILNVEPLWCSAHFVGANRVAPMRWHCGSENRVLRAHLASPRAQVCPACICETGYCRWEWDLAVVTACPIHHTWLVDVCASCRAHLRWDRPCISVCRCKHPITTNDRAADRAAVELAGLISARISSAARPPGAHGLPEFLDHLSVGAVMSAIHAFGDLPDSPSRCFSTVTMKAMPALYWRGVVVRATARLRAWAAGEDVSHLVNAAVLMGFARAATAEPDVAIIGQLTRAVRVPAPPGAQGSLFG